MQYNRRETDSQLEHIMFQCDNIAIKLASDEVVQREFRKEIKDFIGETNLRLAEYDKKFTILSTVVMIFTGLASLVGFDKLIGYLRR